MYLTLLVMLKRSSLFTTLFPPEMTPVYSEGMSTGAKIRLKREQNKYLPLTAEKYSSPGTNTQEVDNPNVEEKKAFRWNLLRHLKWQSKVK